MLEYRVKVAIDAWTSAAGVADGYVFRPVNRADRVAGERLGEKVVWQMLREYFGPVEVLDRLKSFKPLRGVFGNIDGAEIRAELAEQLHWKCEDVHVYMRHIGGHPGHYDPRVKRELAERNPGLFICGHSHIARVIRDPVLGLLHMNPGAAGFIGWLAGGYGAESSENNGGVTMETHQKVTANHLKRNAYLYVRQSTPRQVLENTESTERQYALRRRAAAFGWLETQIIVIDSDLGQSGAPPLRIELASNVWSPRWVWGVPAWSLAWKSRVWPVTRPIGIDYWRSAPLTTR